MEVLFIDKYFRKPVTHAGLFCFLINTFPILYDQITVYWFLTSIPAEAAKTGGTVGTVRDKQSGTVRADKREPEIITVLQLLFIKGQILGRSHGGEIAFGNFYIPAYTGRFLIVLRVFPGLNGFCSYRCVEQEIINRTFFRQGEPEFVSGGV